MVGIRILIVICLCCYIINVYIIMGYFNFRNIVMIVRYYFGYDLMGMCGYLSFSFSIFSIKDIIVLFKVFCMEGSIEKVKVVEIQIEWLKVLVKLQLYYFFIISLGEFNFWDL